MKPPRLPIVATIVVALAVATMIGLGIWQLRRAEWKQALLAEMALAAAAPLQAIDDAPLPADFAFRRARLHLLCPDLPYDARAGRNRAGDSGWAFRAPCRTGANEPVTVIVGWSTQSSDAARIGRLGSPLATGTLVPGPAGALFYLDAAPAPLEPAAPPSPADVPNNHRSYAVQWFAFAAAAALIYALALRRRRHSGAATAGMRA